MGNPIGPRGYTGAQGEFWNSFEKYPFRIEGSEVPSRATKIKMIVFGG